MAQWKQKKKRLYLPAETEELTRTGDKSAPPAISAPAQVTG